MIILGMILLIIGLLAAAFKILVTIGVIIIVVRMVLAILGRTGRGIGGGSTGTDPTWFLT